MTTTRGSEAAKFVLARKWAGKMRFEETSVSGTLSGMSACMLDVYAAV
jgi:hypothetical protein